MGSDAGVAVRVGGTGDGVNVGVAAAVGVNVEVAVIVGLGVAVSVVVGV